MKESWNLTSRKYWWKLLSRLLVLGFSASIILLIFNLLIYLCQLGLDRLPRNVSFIFAVFNLLLVQLVSELVAIWISIISLLIVVAPLKSFKLQSKVKKTIKLKVLALCLMLVFALAAGANNVLYLKEIDMQRPLTISHRGVSDKNGVQNTIPALKKQPSFIQIM
ncbi:hypothetical protein HMPREF9209_2352 [Lactobacillus gasseri 224-1]|uniref:Glycerophosphoryl diester phosphodiesterase membrane domain-containing protein n=1 Tax=Lactobacillus gasseri 224-1 TaxID=679196 RepID=D1YK05_LACGS|nr:hypothetical protein HMPREF9209_2352 [Lactobacillus gasseri 224-1]